MRKDVANEGQSINQDHRFYVDRGPKTLSQRSDVNRPGPLGFISELVGQSFRKNIRWIILGHLLFDLKWARCSAHLQKAKKKR